MAQPLDGIRVIDLSWQGPGPYCTMLLGDMGAEIIRVEEPGLSGRRAASAAAGEGVSSPVPQRLRVSPHVAVNRNKKSITLNLKNDDAREILYKMVKTADVVVEGFRPGVSKRLAVDYAKLSEINPRIVYCSVTGYGQDGPYQRLAGHDLNYISIAGALSVIGEPGRIPAIPSNLVADYGGGGNQAVIGILAALLARDRIGRGQYVDISLMDSVISLMHQEATGYFASGVVPERGNTMLTGALPYYAVYECKDGKFISIGCLEPWLYEALCKALGREDFVAHQMTEGEKRQEIFAFFRQTFKSKTRDEWFEYLKQYDVCVGPVLNVDEVFNDPQVLQRKMVLELDHPTEGKVKQVGVPIKFSETPATVRTFAPERGQHSEEILKGLGYSEQQIAELRQSGAI